MYKKLLEYQEEDKKLKALDDNLKNNEEYKKANTAFRFLKTVNETRMQIEDKAAYLTAQLDELEEKYKKLLDEKAEFDGSEEVGEEDTLNFLKKKSQELSSAFAEIEKNAEKLGQEMNDLLNYYKKLSAEAKAMKEQYEKTKDGVAALQKQTEARKAEMNVKLNELAKTIPPELMAKYQLARKTGKFPLVYLVDSPDTRHCVACGTEFSALEIATLKKDKFIECENCRKLIFVKN